MTNRLSRLVIINQDSGYLVIDIINKLSERDIDLSLIAGRVVERNIPLDDTIKLRRIIRYRRNSKLNRILSWFLAFIQIIVIVKTKYRKDHLFIFSNPPVSVFLPFFCRNKFSLMIYDVYPDVLLEMGIIKEGSVIERFWKNQNRRVLGRAENIFTLTNGMALSLKKYAINKEINIVPLWGDNNFIKPIPKRSNSFIVDNNLNGRFVVMYSGNLGATHNVEILAELASRVNDPRVMFLIVGEGDQKKYLEDRVRKLKLDNFCMMPLQPVEIIPYSFSSADVAIVSLSENASGMSIPSKAFSYMSAGVPLLCISGEGSELKSLIEKYNNGKWFSPDRIDHMVAFVEDMARNAEILERYQANSILASLDFTAENAGVIADILCKTT